ncbi:MAG: pseudouridine synthase [Anaerolineales bacterium]|nr:pseudouridine synthase [Anaerolineales bacterium]
MPERLQKVLARAGIGSRRKCEAIIRAGRVTVNGRTATIGMKVNPSSDDIRLDGERIQPAQEEVYLILYKPVGVLSSFRSQGGKPTLLDLVDVPQRLFPVGRLDLKSEGLVLLTNNGELANRIQHPRYEHEKEYRVLLNRLPDASQLSTLRRGVVLPDGTKALPMRIWRDEEHDQAPWIRMVLRQGRKRQIREMVKTIGLSVRKLIRVRIGPVVLGNLRPGEWRALTKSEIGHLKSYATSITGRHIGSNSYRHRKPRRKHKSNDQQKRRSGRSG